MTGHRSILSVDPDDELITSVAVTAANTADRDVLDDLLDEPATSAHDHGRDGRDDRDDRDGRDGRNGQDRDRDDDNAEGAAGAGGRTDPVGTAGWQVYGDSAYADGQTLHDQAERGNDQRVKVPPARNARGYSKDEFRIDPQAGTVGCPAGHTAPIRPLRRGGQARFGQWCGDCPLRAACTTARGGRVITIHPREAELQRAKARQRDPDWQRAYRTHRPTVERKISHFTRRPWGGRQARCRGQARILTDVLTRAGAINLARLAALGLQHRSTGWVIA